MVRPRLFRQSSNQVLSAVAFTLFAVTVVGFISFSIQEFNQQVAWEQRDLENAAMGIRFAVDSFSTDYRPQFRFHLLIISLLVFLTLLERRLLAISFLLSLIALPIIYVWISSSVRDLQVAENYMPETLYPLRIATSFDWVVFGLFGVVLIWTTVELITKNNKIASRMR